MTDRRFITNMETKYLPPKPILNTTGIYTITVTVAAPEWKALDARARQLNIARAGLARRILREALTS